MRYHLILDECPATSSSYWNKVYAKTDKIIDMCRPLFGIASDQLWHILDSKTGKIISEEEYRNIILRIAD